MTRILIAEDNAVNRELLRELLEARGYTVVEACDGQEALRMIEQTHPDIVLLDKRSEERSEHPDLTRADRGEQFSVFRDSGAALAASGEN
jgi:CheY-like chemotaxis protein